MIAIIMMKKKEEWGGRGLVEERNGFLLSYNENVLELDNGDGYIT